MARRIVVLLTLLTLVALACSGPTHAGKFNEKVNVGDKAPVWKSLAGTDGKSHSLTELADAKAVVVVVTCNNCPVAKAYEDRLIAFVKEYQPKGVELVAINPNKTENLDVMKARAEEQGFNFAYIKDESQEVAQAYGATVTPHVFLLDGNRTIAYMGAIDDNMNDAKVGQHYLRSAADAVLAGRSPAETETRQFGCGIKWK